MTPSEKLTENVKAGTEIVKNAIDKVNPANYNSAIKNCFPIINYICFFILFCVSFIALYISNSVLLGISLLYVINAIYTIFLIKDMFSIKKSEQVISMILFAILIMNAISSTFIILTLRKLHTRYNTKK